MQIDITVLLDNLKAAKSKRTQVSLDKLNSLLEKRFDAGEQDYSIATIGRISKTDGGIGEVSIRNKTGNHFRLLIEAWANNAQEMMKKPPVKHSRKNEIPTDMELLQQLNDPVMRVIFGQIIAERNKLKKENRIIKQNTEIIIDMRPKQISQNKTFEQGVEVLPALEGILLKSEIEALKDAINESSMKHRGWSVSKLGSVKDENDRPLFKTGFVIAIQKILTEI